ncbi:PREDICTED: venom acid phosphatase Acph-1-like [Dinoponera quadriceps]|uniref:acid phosphatase n=1 Tax=Dinoponera quadriceps TaxID=609295 RepID=A0A6P3YA59_DINQU|nr:PREDICTED: venom acid phosphatase Acph-1-like [Dinoponera quadriceps]
MAKLQYHLSIVLMSCFGIFTGLEAHSKQSENDSTKLRLINTVFRHGDRTMEIQLGESYPNDPNKNFNSYPDGDGQLTNVGKKRAYDLGVVLRKKYNDFLGDVYYQPNVHARSTSFPRTKMTLQLVLAGLYPPARIQKWHSSLAWQPVNIQYTFVRNDGLLFPAYCPEYQQKLSEIEQTPEVIAQIQQYEDLMKETSKYTGKNMTSAFDLFILFNTFVTQKYLGLPLPDWAGDKCLQSKLFDAAIFYYNLMSYNDELTRLNGGILLHRMIQDMKGVINGTLVDRKINLFSAHDINVVAMLKALDIYDNTFPSFTSTVIVELHEKDNNYFVKVLRYLGDPSQMIEVRIPGCDMLCPYDKFVKLRLAATATDEENPKCPRTLLDHL